MTMTDVTIPFGENGSDNAVLLLAAAEELDLDPSYAVRTVTSGFVVSQEVADKAGIKVDSPEGTAPTDDEPDKPVEKTPAKKAPAKKAAAAKDKE